MLKIGDFSTLSKISIHMLRNYDKIGLLTPAHVDDTSSYRYYEENQLTTANRIQALKSMGLGLNTIKEIIQQYDSSESLADYLSIQAISKREEIDRLALQLQQLEHTIDALQKKDNLLQYSIEVKELPSRLVACTRDKIPEYHYEGTLWRTLFTTLKEQKIPYANPSYNIAVFRDEGFVENGIDVEIQKTVQYRGINTEKVYFKQTPTILAASLTYQGSYTQLSEINELIADWVLHNQYEFCGSHFNIYHTTPATETDAEKLVTEVCFPLRKVTS